MGSAKKVLLTLIALFLIVIFCPTFPREGNLVRGDSPPNSPYTGFGSNLTVFEFAQNQSAIFTNGFNDTSFTYLNTWYPLGYRGYNLYATISELIRTDDPVPNGNFDVYDENFHIAGTQIDDEVHNWTLSLNEGKDDSSRIIAQIDNATSGNPDDCMDIKLRYDQTGLIIAAAQVDNDFDYISAIAPENLTLGFDIKFSADITQESWLSVKVVLLHQAAEIGSWESTTDIYHPTNWEHHSFPTLSVNGSVILRIIIQKEGGNKRAAVSGHIFFDNFRYVIGTASKPSEVDLELNGKTIQDDGGQTGFIDIYADESKKEEAPLSNCWDSSQAFQFYSPYNISFHYQYLMGIKCENADAATAFFSAPVDQNPIWEINYTIPQNRPPAGHIGYSFGLYLNDEWQLVSVKNSLGQTISDYEYNSSSHFIKLNEDIASPDDTFSIIVASLNYVLQIYPQKSTSSTGPWTNVSLSNYFVAGNFIRVLAKLRPIGGVGNSADISLFYPNNSLWKQDVAPIIFANNDTLLSTSWQVPIIQEADAGSQWKITVAFDNSTECGLRQQSFTIAIHAKGTAISPISPPRVIWGQTVLVNVTWQNNDTNSYIPDASARARYIDRNLQVQYQSMTPNGQGAYSAYLATGSMSPGPSTEFDVELFRTGYVNATYLDGTSLSFTINLVNDINYQMIKPTQLTGPDEYTAETTQSEGYTSQVRFYDPYQSAYVRNDSSVWKDHVRINYTYYEDPTGSQDWTEIGTGTLISDAGDPTLFYKYDASYSNVERVKYEITMRIIDTGWDFEQQNFTIIIRIVAYATNLDAVRTKIQYPPTGTGDGWTQYENATDIYVVHLYWNEVFNITVYYENESSSMGINGATVRLLIGYSLYDLSEKGNGFYNYTLNSNVFGLGQSDLFVNATCPAHAAQTIRIRLIIESRATSLTKDYPRSSVEIPYDDDFTITFTYYDIVPTIDLPISNAIVTISGYETGKYTTNNNGDGTYTLIFWGNITEMTYYVTISFSQTNYTSKSQYLEITVRPTHTYTTGSVLIGSIPWGDNVTIILKFNDTDHFYSGIPGSLITFNWFDNLENTDYWIIDLGNGIYSITLNTTKVPAGTQAYTITFTLSKMHYDSAQIAISFQVRDILTVLYIVSLDPGTSIPWGDNLTLMLTFNDTDHGFLTIPSAILTCDWNPFYWSYFYNTTDGTYLLNIRSECRLEGSYTLRIYASQSHYQTFMTLQGFVIRSIQTSYAADPMYVPAHPWGDNLTIRIFYIDMDHGGYIPFAELDSNWDEGYYTIIWFGNGTYLIELNTTCREVGGHTLQLYLSRTHYMPQTVTIELTFRNILTGYSVNPTYVPSNPWGDNITIRINYLDLDHTLYIPGATVSVNWNASYYTIYYLGNGTYVLELNTTCREIGTYKVAIQLARIHYATQNLQVDITLRNIQTDFNADTTIFPSHPWGDNVTVRIDFLDFDHNSFISNAIILTDWNVGYYSIYSLNNGTYIIEFNTTCRSNGVHITLITLSRNHYSSQTVQVKITLRDIQTDVDASPLYVSSHPWGVNLTILADYIDLDHSSYVLGASIVIDWDVGFYSIYNLGNGTYLIELNTTCRDAGSYSVQINLARLHYESMMFNVEFTLRGRNTQVTYDPPEPVAATDSLSFTMYYNDSDTTNPIANVTGNVRVEVTCSTNPSLILNYTITMLNSGYDGYLITIETNNFPTVNKWYTFLVNVSWAHIVPFYQNHSIPISGYVRAIHTSLELDFISFLYWGDILYVNATYRDLDHDLVLSGDLVNIWLSWPSWSIAQNYSDGTYLLQINTASEDVGLANFTIRFSSSLCETSEQRVQFTINPLPVYIEVLSASPWIAEYQTSVNITVRVTDEYNRLINNSQTVYYWAGLAPVLLTFIGNGQYNATFLANKSVGTYLVTIEARNPPNYQTGIGIVMLTIIPIDSVLSVIGPTSPIVVGDSFVIEVNFSTIYGSPLPTATIYYSWAGVDGTLIYQSGWTFNATISSIGLDAGQYMIYISASHPNVVEQLRTISINLIVMPAYLDVGTPVINVEWGIDFTILAHFYDNNLLPITGAIIQYFWGNLNGSLSPTGTPGWYNISLPSDIFNVGVYQLTLTCDHEGYQFARTTVGLNIQPRHTNLQITEINAYLEEADLTIPLNGTNWTIPRGDILYIYFNLTDNAGQAVSNATAVYTWSLGSGVLQYLDGLYLARINLTDVTPSLYPLNIILTRHNYETANAPPIQLNVISVPTSISGLDDTLQIYTGESINLDLTFYDTYHSITIDSAALHITIPGLGYDKRPLINNGDGTYSLIGLTSLIEGTYFITIESDALPKYAQATSTATLIVQLSPLFRAAIQGGAVTGIILIIILFAWLAYARVYSIPWIVRRMRRMAKTIDSGKEPKLSTKDQSRISQRDDQIISMMRPSYETADIAAMPIIAPISKITEERRSEDDAIWAELEQLEGLGTNEKEELFIQMKKIPAKDRVWFMEDMKRQMTEGRFDYLRTGDAVDVAEEMKIEEPKTSKLSPVEQATLVAVLREGFEQFTMISDEDKDALVQQLIIMTPEERESMIKKLMARMKGLQHEESKSLPKLEKRRKKSGT